MNDEFVRCPFCRETMIDIVVGDKFLGWICEACGAELSPPDDDDLDDDLDDDVEDDDE